MIGKKKEDFSDVIVFKTGYMVLVMVNRWLNRLVWVETKFSDLNQILHLKTRKFCLKPNCVDVVEVEPFTGIH